MPPVQSAIREGAPVTGWVKRWEGLAAAEPDANAATTQLVYELLVQVRMIKLILVWVMVILPLLAVGAGVAIYLLADAAEASSTSPYGL